MRRLLKFLHTLGAVGFMGGMAALAAILLGSPATSGAAGHVPAMARVAVWVIGPSMMLTVIAGLLAMAVTPAFQDAAWVWAKTATGILILEGGLHVLGPLQEEAKRGAGGSAASDPAGVSTMLAAEANTLWLLLGVSLANIALAIWRPRMPKLPF